SGAGDHELDPLVGEVVDAAQVGRVRLRHHDHQRVPREDDRLRAELLRVEPGGERRVRGGEDVGGRALLDLRRERVRAAERVFLGLVDLREDVGQRGGGVDGQLRLLRGRRRAGRDGGDCDRDQERSPHQLWISTLVDFTSAVVAMPGFSPISSTASRVTRAVSRTGSLTTISTWAIRPSVLTSVTIPCRRLRALMCDPSPSPRRRSTSAAATSRRFRSSRVTVTRPALSQRRSVSRLIPRAAAASLAVYRFFGTAQLSNASSWSEAALIASARGNARPTAPRPSRGASADRCCASLAAIWPIGRRNSAASTFPIAPR